MALTHDSMARAARAKTLRAQHKVWAAERELLAANDALAQALPIQDLQAIAQAARQTLAAEVQVRAAAEALESANLLLGAEEEQVPLVPAAGATAGPGSGSGTRSLLLHLKGQRR